MNTAETSDGPGRCAALTADGDRCSRPAREGRFCYQHDESDPTVDEPADPPVADGGAAESEGDESSADVETEEPESAVEPADDADEQAAGGADAQPDDSAPEEDGAGASIDDVPDIVAVRQSVERAAEGIIGRPLDGVLEVSPDEGGGWRVEVEVVERAAVPDTQDILGRYEVQVDDDATVRGYSRLERYRRGDTSPSQPT